MTGSKWLRWVSALAFAAFSGIAAADFSGKVTGVSDGDTLSVLRNGRAVKIRIAGIDAPEKNQPWGMQSKKALSEAVFKRTVRIETRKKDRYGRTLGRVLLDGHDIGLRQIEQGLAWHYRQYSRDQPGHEARDYAAAEKRARTRRAGLWQQKQPSPPWVWRRKH